MSRPLTTTARVDLQRRSCVNTHFCFDPSVYTLSGRPSPAAIDAVVQGGFGSIREGLWPRNRGQQAAFTQLAGAGVGLFVFVTAKTPELVIADVLTLAEMPYAANVVGICGPNEPNSAGGPSWAAHTVDLQHAIWDTVSENGLFPEAPVVGPALKHNGVADYDADLAALQAAGIENYCDALDFHFYPGNAGPIGNEGERARAQVPYVKNMLHHSETGWTLYDTNPQAAAAMSVETYLRQPNEGAVFLYELADEAQYVAGREGHFGLLDFQCRPKPAYLAVQRLLTTPDGGQEFPGWLASYAPDVDSDCKVLVTSEGNSQWTVYLMRIEQESVTLVVPDGFHVTDREYVIGPRGNYRYAIDLTDTSLVVVHVTHP